MVVEGSKLYLNFLTNWIENFCMSHSTYHYLCDPLCSEILRVDMHYRRAIRVEKIAAITLCFLATPGKYHTIAHLFGVARCIVHVSINF